MNGLMKFLLMNFMNLVLLNDRATRVQQEVRSIRTVQNDIQNTNVWKFINEKDYWHCQNCM